MKVRKNWGKVLRNGGEYLKNLGKQSLFGDIKPLAGTILHRFSGRDKAKGADGRLTSLVGCMKGVKIKKGGFIAEPPLLLF